MNSKIASAASSEDLTHGPKRAQIVLLNASYAPSLVNFRGNFIQAMISAGHEVHVSAPDFDNETLERVSGWGATAHPVHLARSGQSPVADFRYALQLRKLIRGIGANLVINYTIKPNIWGSFAASSAGVDSASMVTGLGYTFIADRGLGRKLLSLISRSLYRLSSGCNRVVIFQNEDDCADFIQAGCLPGPAKARLVNGSGVDMDHFSSTPLPAKPVCLMVARLLIDKGTREYAEAAMALLSRRDDCRFLLAGFLDSRPNGITAEELASWQDAGIEFLGKLSDVRPAIAESSIFLLPSYREGTPRSVLEAMSMGRPIITTDVPGCRETVIDGDNGFLIPAQDVESLIGAMEKLIDSAALRSEMGKRSRAVCAEKFEVGQVNAALMAHLDL